MHNGKLAAILLFCIHFTANSQDTLPATPNPVETKLWANIFASYYYNLKGNNPINGFEMPTALLGYSAETQQFKGTLIFDVARTTGDINVSDSLGNLFIVRYREGSSYTVFLKMAELKYSPTSYISLKFGQLLNTQYLTTQDKFWGYRYVYFTFQEIHRYGNPADFGFQSDINLQNKALFQISVTNGDGPFRYQDNNGKLLFASNVEWYPVSGAILKIYADYAPASEQIMEAPYKSTLAAFAGYKTNRLRIGTEFSQVTNYKFGNNRKYWGYSSFASVKLIQEFDVFARHDYINQSAPLNLSKAHFFIGGLQYQPLEKLQCALSIRYLNTTKESLLFFSAGGKF